MAASRKPGFVLPLAVLTVLLGLYVGAYYAMVEPVPFDDDPPDFEATYYCPFAPFLESRRGLGLRVLRWQTECDAFFAPIHWLDRRIRPNFWGLTRTEEFAPAL
jgi:hypothetical protein